MSKNTKPTAPVKTEGEGEAPVVATEASAPVVETAQPPKVKKPAPAGAGFCAYIGPTIHGVIQSGHIYPGTREKVLKTIAPIVEKYPLAATLLVDGSTLEIDRIKVKTPGNILFVNYHKLAAGKN